MFIVKRREIRSNSATPLLDFGELVRRGNPIRLLLPNCQLFFLQLLLLHRQVVDLSSNQCRGVLVVNGRKSPYEVRLAPGHFLEALLKGS